MKRTRLSPTTPREMLLEEFLKPMGISPYRLAKSINVPQIRISKIIRRERAITPDTALRLARFFTTSAEFWMNLQIGYDLKIARQQTGKKIDETIEPLDRTT